ncbi:hypothetical protein [Leptothrix ochracea]|uniref:hypothetical protein n=1 Tax=Leptothrix ochracea TaxID=735331 RepID=UPI0034E2A5DD
MNDDDNDDGGDNYYFDMDRLLPRGVSDEAATLLCDFLAELTVIAETRYEPHCRRHRDAHPPPVDRLHPWRNMDID